MVTKLKKVSGGIVVLLIGIIVIVLYVAGEHHVKSLYRLFWCSACLGIVKAEKIKKAEK